LGNNEAAHDLVDDNPISIPFPKAVAEYIGKIITQFSKGPIKCLVCDLDNTLWGGIVGESGASGLLLSDTGAGKAYKTLQAEIVKLTKQGIVLALCSKNNTCDALEVMEQHPHMLIRPNLVSCYRINWEEKSKNIIEIAEELNIGLDAIAFLDDSPMERDKVRHVLPDVEVLELPQDHFLFAEVLRRFSRLWPIVLTEADFQKTKQYKENKTRAYERSMTKNVEDYLAKSEIIVTIASATKETLPRITQLFMKTNQFNLTTIRYSQNELEKLIEAQDNHLFSMAMKDKYGDYGIIAAVLIRKDTIDSFVMSCRAFGRGVEKAFLFYCLRVFTNKKISTVLAQYIPSQKNSMVKDFYKDAGFVLQSKTEEKEIWAFQLEKQIYQNPLWIDMTIL
jgi:FkbH-like protein